MRFEKLGDIAEIRTGKFDANHSTDDGGYQFYTCAMEQFKSPTYSFEGKSIILPGNGANVGEVFFNEEDKFEAYQRTYVIQKIKANPKYVFYFFKSNWKRSLKNAQYGSATNYIRLNNITDFIIPIPNLPDQLHIANILSQAEILIAQRKESIRLLDEFLKSTFLEMFGDPVRNEKKWSVDRLNTVISGIDSGWSPVCLNKSRNNDSEWAILKLSSVTYRRFNPNANKLLDQNILVQKELVPKKGDLLFSRKNTSDLVGATVFILEDYNRLLLPDTIFRINYMKDKISGLYLWFLFNHVTFRKVIQLLASGAAGSMPNISKEKLSKLKISIPPIALQTQFAQIVEKTEALKIQYQQSLQELEDLYGSLSQRAFKGELTARMGR